MQSQQIQKQRIAWNIQTFQQSSNLTSLLYHHYHSLPPIKEHHQLRDFYFHPTLKPTSLKQDRKTFIEYAGSLLDNYFSFNQIGYLQSIHFQHTLLKHKFWKDLYDRPSRNEQDHKIKEHVTSVVWTYRLLPISLFTVGIIGILRLTGVYRMSFRRQVGFLLTAALVCDVLVRSKMSSSIFYLLPQLPNPELERKRVDIVNKSIVLDARINSVSERPDFVNQLISEAAKEQDSQEQLLILQAAGFKVVDRKDYDYEEL